MHYNYGHIALAMIHNVVTCIVTVQSFKKKKNDSPWLTTYDTQWEFLSNAVKDILKL